MIFVKESVIEAAPERVFAFHEQPDVLRLLVPPWERLRMIKHAETLAAGARAIFETRLFGVWPVRWVAEHTAYDPPRMFEDVQVSGPFKSWRHRHIVRPHARGALLRDEIEYEPPLGFLGRLFAPLLVERRLEKMFEYRHAVTRRWCEAETGEGNSSDVRRGDKC